MNEGNQAPPSITISKTAKIDIPRAAWGDRLRERKSFQPVERAEELEVRARGELFVERELCRLRGAQPGETDSARA